MHLSTMLFATSSLILMPLAQVHAQAWPVKPIRMLVNSSPGTANDLLARNYGPRVAKELGQPVVVENRAGAGGNIGLEALARSAPDGYTFIQSPGGALVLGPHLYKLSFDAAKDFTPVASTVRVPLGLVVRADLPVRSVAELIAYGRANPGKINYGSSGSGTTVHLAGEMLLRAANIKGTHVPYKGVPETLTALFSGDIDFYFDPGPATPHIKSGKVRLLAVAAAARSPVFPEIPTMAEAGTEVDVDLATGVFAPAGTSSEIVSRLNREINRQLQTAETRALLLKLGGEAVISSPEEFAARLQTERDRFGAIIRQANIRAD